MDLNFKDNYNDKYFGVEIVDFLNAAESNKLVIDLNKKQQNHLKKVSRQRFFIFCSQHPLCAPPP